MAIKKKVKLSKWEGTDMKKDGANIHSPIIKSLFYVPVCKTIADNAVKWYNQLALEAYVYNLAQTYDLTQTHDVARDAGPGSDLPPKLQVLLYLFAAYEDLVRVTRHKLVHPFATYVLKLHLFQIFRANSESDKLQTGLVHLFATYSLTLHVRERFSRPIKVV